EMAAVLERMQRRAVGEQERRAGLEVHSGRQRRDAVGGDETLLRKTAAARRGDDAIARRDTAHGRSHLFDDSGELHPRRERERRLYLVEALDEQSVGKVQRAGLHLDDDFVRGWPRR